VRLHSATYEVPAQVILLDRDVLKPGESAYVQLRLREPALLLSGDSYILRVSSPTTTVGGGVVLDPFPPRRRRRSSEALQLLDALATAEHRQTIALIIRQSLLSGITFEDILLRSGLSRKTVDALLTTLLSSGEVLQMTREPRIFLSRESLTILKRGLLDELASFLAANPLKEGMGKEELVELTRQGALKTPRERWDRSCTVLDVAGDAAAVRAETPWFVDYFHMGRFGGRWIIVNALWHSKP